ncbi:GNAT family N-acetyltransferase [Marinobacter sp. X15-166B]|uniref:GNAT family N-acetyltransferase n=1 Tax=Marinobacter sp. X15-166B TaxID=1897620 RepID=UPI001D16FD42|nr:N-acetyltransferase [Marinobacter sp. X15-166B]
MDALIRAESADDVAPIHRVIERAFRAAAHTDHTEHFIVAALRRAEALTISRVAEAKGEVIAHVAISPVCIADGTSGWLGLGPVAVLPEYQRQGVGTRLLRSALADLKALGAAGCVVLGEPGFYSRFGFEVMDGLKFLGAPAEYFQALTFDGRVPQGEVTYHKAFSVRG